MAGVFIFQVGVALGEDYLHMHLLYRIAAYNIYGIIYLLCERHKALEKGVEMEQLVEQYGGWLIGFLTAVAFIDILFAAAQLVLLRAMKVIVDEIEDGEAWFWAMVSPVGAWVLLLFAGYAFGARPGFEAATTVATILVLFGAAALLFAFATQAAAVVAITNKRREWDESNERLMNAHMARAIIPS